MGGGGGGLEQFSVSPRPLGFGFGTNGFWAKGLGSGLDKMGIVDFIHDLEIFQQRTKLARAVLNTWRGPGQIAGD